jgi:hypothetical protein
MTAKMTGATTTSQDEFDRVLAFSLAGTQRASRNTLDDIDEISKQPMVMSRIGFDGHSIEVAQAKFTAGYHMLDRHQWGETRDMLTKVEHENWTIIATVANEARTNPDLIQGMRQIKETLDELQGKIIKEAAGAPVHVSFLKAVSDRIPSAISVLQRIVQQHSTIMASKIKLDKSAAMRDMEAAGAACDAGAEATGQMGKILVADGNAINEFVTALNALENFYYQFLPKKV